MATQARITYYLSEQGRRDSLRQGGDGRRLQQVIGMVDDADLDAFMVDDDGQVSFDATASFFSFVVPASKGRMVKTSPSKTAPKELHWDVVPVWDDLVAIARQLKAANDDMAAAFEEDALTTARIVQEFLDDPSARPTRVDAESVVVGGRHFWNDHSVATEARRRWNADQEELKKANRATLADWIGRHGNENQRQRLLAGLLPWKEAYDTAEAHIFKPLDAFPIYTRFKIEDVCEHVRSGGEACKVKFQSVDATELTAEEWEQFSQIQAAVPGAMFQLREHRAECTIAFEAQMRRGVIVKFTMGQLTFKREFALWGGSHDTL